MDTKNDELEIKLKDLPPVIRALLTDARRCAWPFLPNIYEGYERRGPIEVKKQFDLKDLLSTPNSINPGKTQIDILQESLFLAMRSKSYDQTAAILFVIDRYAYWKGASDELLKVAQRIQKHSPNTPIAPQIVIRRARVLVSKGSLQSAERILVALISSGMGLTLWQYQTESDYRLVKAVCIQIRGQIRLKLSLWREAAEFILDSIVMYRQLALIDRKGISASLGLLVDIYTNISKSDYASVRHLYNLREVDPLIEAYQSGLEAARLCPFTAYFQTRGLRRAGAALVTRLSMSDVPPQEKLEILVKTIEVLTCSILCIDPMETLNSSEQLHEFVNAAHNLGQAMRTAGMHSAQVLLDNVTVLYQILAEYDKGGRESIDGNIKNITNSVVEFVKELQGSIDITIDTGDRSYYDKYMIEIIPVAGPSLDIKECLIDRRASRMKDVGDQDCKSQGDSVDFANSLLSNTNYATIDSDTIGVISTDATTVADDLTGGSIKDPSATTLIGLLDLDALPDPVRESKSPTKKRADFRKHFLETDKRLSMLRTPTALPNNIYRAIVHKYVPGRDDWDRHYTLLYIGDKLPLPKDKEGKQRNAFWVGYVTQDELIGRYVGKIFRQEKVETFDERKIMEKYKQDIKCQTIARDYVSAFNARLTGVALRGAARVHELQYLPAVFVEVLGSEIKFVNVEPYIDGEWVKLSNNGAWVNPRFRDGIGGTFSHFSYEWSEKREMVVDLQGWIPAADEDLLYLTDPQIHNENARGRYGLGNRGNAGIRDFFKSQHKNCNLICQAMGLKQPWIDDIF